jgi:hypothetical protein
MMRRDALLSLALVPLLAAPLLAQSSQFGVRGLGLPGRAASARVIATGGAMGLFDGESSQNPAALATLSMTTAVFTMANAYRTSVNPSGTATGQDHRFPQLLIGGPVPRSRFVVAASYSMFADRDFQLVSSGFASPRGVPIGVTDTLTSRGGIADMRIATAYAISPRFIVGGGVHFLTGSNRMSTRRVWADDDYAALDERAELSFHTIGFSGGVLLRPTPRLDLAATIRRDGTLQIERDSTPSSKVAMPMTISGAARLHLSRSLDLAGSVTLRNWSRADAGLVGAGAVGSRDTKEYSAGVELFSDARRTAHKPLRLGVRYADLPFLLDATGQPDELGLSIGTGVRFARDLGGLDLAVERVKRTQGSGYSETAWQVTLGISVRPGT